MAGASKVYSVGSGMFCNVVQAAMSGEEKEVITSKGPKGIPANLKTPENNLDLPLSLDFQGVFP